MKLFFLAVNREARTVSYVIHEIWINHNLDWSDLQAERGSCKRVRVAKTLKEACELAKAGFEYFTEIEDVQVFRKKVGGLLKRLACWLFPTSRGWLATSQILLG